jgi:hypothetical protein
MESATIPPRLIRLNMPGVRSIWAPNAGQTGNGRAVLDRFCCKADSGLCSVNLQRQEGLMFQSVRIVSLRFQTSHLASSRRAQGQGISLAVYIEYRGVTR